MDSETRGVLEKVYTDPREPGSYTSVDKLKKAIKAGKELDVTARSVKEWLKSKETYTKHRPSRKVFKRNPVIAAFIDAQWQGDLAEVGNLAAFNTGVRYLLILIDVVSKYMWVEPLKSKSGPTVLEGFKKVFGKTPRRPSKLQTDDGKEFWYQGVQRFLKDHKIIFFTLKSDKKAAVAERAVKTIKEKIYRYMHEKNTKKYIDVLGDLVASYNETYHQAIKMTPAEVNVGNEGEVLKNLYRKTWETPEEKRKAKLRAGDYVRLNGIKGVFKKGYTGNWTEEIFIVDKVMHSAPHPLYKLKDWSGEAIEGSFYEQEVQKVSVDLKGFWKVEKIVARKKVGRKNMCLVKWQEYPSSMNTWVEESEMKRI